MGARRWPDICDDLKKKPLDLCGAALRVAHGDLARFFFVIQKMVSGSD